MLLWETNELQDSKSHFTTLVCSLLIMSIDVSIPKSIYPLLIKMLTITNQLERMTQILKLIHQKSSFSTLRWCSRTLCYPWGMFTITRSQSSLFQPYFIQQKYKSGTEKNKTVSGGRERITPVLLNRGIREQVGFNRVYHMREKKNRARSKPSEKCGTSENIATWAESVT